MSARELWHWTLRIAWGMGGLDAYDRYLAHHRHCHPEVEAPTRGEFYRAKWDHESRTSSARCC